MNVEKGKTMRSIINKAGFSLVEVNMAILIAAGGLLALFSLFPGGLRHSVMSQEDLYQATFANSLLDVISTNVRKIEDVTDWNNPETFWRHAIGNLGRQGVPIDDLQGKFKTPSQAKNDSAISDATQSLVEKNRSYVWFAYQEKDKVDSNPPSATILFPPQYFIRLRQESSRDNLPARYAVSVVSTHMPAPANYHRNTVYSMNFYFCGRP
ncbi:MAG: type IV pilus modification PilV family protein [Kiritimatiellia bacterium]|jgi:Tfp pilus assembly protein PilV